MKLPLLLDDVAATAARIGEWPCHRGCADCCRALAEPMRISRDEWALLEPVIATLAPSTRATIAARLADTRTCALLDRESGACLVYAGRPIACRAYGMYAGRDGGRWCSQIETRPQLTSSVILGNHDRLQTELASLGEARTLAEWWNELPTSR